MIRTIITSTTLAIALTAFGCSKAADAQKEADKAQAEANKEITIAMREANEKRAEAQAEIAKAEQKADDKAIEAQAEANKEIAKAQASFESIREDYRHDINEKLVDLDRKIETMSADALKAKGQAKRDLDAHLTNIRLRRAQLGDELAKLDEAAAVTWDAAKARADAKLKELQDAIDKAD